MTLATTEMTERDDGPLRTGASAEADDGPLRRCIATGAHAAPDAMIRFVVGPDDSVYPDLSEDLPGRGLWVAAEAGALAKAAAKNAFARAARRPVTVPEGLAAAVVAGLSRRCLETLSLARRAGQVVSGYERVVEALRGEPDRWTVVVEATDATDNARKKMRGPAGERPVVRVAEGASMGAVLGRDRCVHACVARGGLAERLVRDGTRLAGLTPADDPRTGK